MLSHKMFFLSFSGSRIPDYVKFLIMAIASKLKINGIVSEKFKREYCEGKIINSFQESAICSINAITINANYCLHFNSPF